MQKEMLKETIGLPWFAQAAIVRDQGYAISNFQTRIFFDVIRLLHSGTCPDTQTLWSWVRNSQMTILSGISFQLRAGCLMPSSSLRIDIRVPSDNDRVGVVPCLLPDVATPALPPHDIA